MRGWLPPLLAAAALTWRPGLARPAGRSAAGTGSENSTAPATRRSAARRRRFDRSLMIPKAQIEADLQQLKPVADCIRTYAVDQGLDQAVPVAAALGMKVLSVSGSVATGKPMNGRSRPPSISPRPIPAPSAHHRRNEVLLRGEQTGETLAGLATRVRTETGLPVTYADVWEYWLRRAVLKDSVDFITIHSFPTGRTIRCRSVPASPISTRSSAKSARSFPAGRSWWARRLAERRPLARGCGALDRQSGALSAGIPGLRQDPRARLQFHRGLRSTWKRWLEGTAGGFWGLFDEARAAKFPWSEPVSEYPNWPIRAGISLVLGLGIWCWRASGGIAPAAGNASSHPGRDDGRCRFGAAFPARMASRAQRLGMAVGMRHRFADPGDGGCC